MSANQLATPASTILGFTNNHVISIEKSPITDVSSTLTVTRSGQAFMQGTEIGLKLNPVILIL
jgi:hypothetical protein